MKKLTGMMMAAALIAGCGGGGGGSDTTTAPAPASAPAPAPAPAPQQASSTGLWNGTTNTNRTVTGIVLADGTYYVLYSKAGVPTTIAGVMQGTGTVSGSTFSSSDGRDFNLEGAGVLPVTLAATVVTKASLSGTVTYSTATTTFTSTYNANFEQTPTLAAVAGTYSGQVAFSQGVENATVTVSSTGAISGAGASTCAVSGSVVPRTDGNAYDLTVAFGGAPCYFAGQTFKGAAYYDAATKRLYGAAPNSVRSDGVLFVGSKP